MFLDFLKRSEKSKDGKVRIRANMDFAPSSVFLLVVLAH